MRFASLLAVLTLVPLAGCGGASEAPAERASPAASAAPAVAASPTGGWNLQSSGEGVALALTTAAGATVVRLFCPAAGEHLMVNVPGFHPVGSEERLSFGSGGTVGALVADPRGDPARGGVTGAGAVPANLAALIAGPVAVSYGAQTRGAQSAPPAGPARDFVAACNDRPAAARTAAVSACQVQDGRPLAVEPLRAVGTEPFWGARIEGRCVTYSHPEKPAGTRVWTRYVPATGGGATWTGALDGRRFELRTRPAPDCSDGMSDKRYPLAVELAVAGETRRGCAEPT